MKLKERVAIAVMAGLVLLTVVLVLDVETRITAGGHPQTPAHARVQYAFRQRHLQKTSNGSREALLAAAASGQLNGINDDPANPPPQAASVLGQDRSVGKEDLLYKPASPPDPYTDLQKVVDKVDILSKKNRRRRKHWNPSLGELLGLDLG